jgi:hypothetical protein
MTKSIFRDGDIIAGALTAALGTYITVTASRWDVMGPEGPGPGFFPIGYGIALIILSLILIFQRFTAARHTEEDRPFDWAGACLEWHLLGTCADLWQRSAGYGSCSRWSLRWHPRG